MEFDLWQPQRGHVYSHQLGGILNSVDDTIAPALTVASGGTASVRGVTLQSGFVVRTGGTLNLGAPAGAFYGASLISNYVILASTNVAVPMASWKPVATNQFDVNGQLHFTNPVTPAQPRQFFIFKLP